MDGNELKKWLDKYNEEEDSDFPGLEKNLGEKIRAQRFVGRDDLVKILRWKYQDKLRGRGEYFVGKLDRIDKQVVENLTALALARHNEDQKIKMLDDVPTVGPAVLSVILSFYDPKNYGIFDIHSWREFFGKESKNLFTQANYKRLLEQLRNISRTVNWTCRDIEKAYFKKNKDKTETLIIKC